MSILKNMLTPRELIDCLGGITAQGVYKALKSHQIPIILTATKRKLISSSGVRKLFEERGFTYPCKNLSFQLIKGGVGKTSLSFSLCVRAYHYGARVLAIDLDQQGNLTRSFNVEARDKPVWLELFRDRLPIEDVLLTISDHLHLIPSNLNNSRLEVELSAANLKDMISDIIAPVRKNYDLVVMDCPPALNKVNTAATCTSDLVIMPVNPDAYAMDGLDFTIVELEKIKKNYKLEFDYRIVWNKYDARERLGTIYLHALAKRDELFSKILPVVCRVDSSLKNAIFDAKSIFELPKKSYIKEDIDQFTKEILGINVWKDLQSE